MVNAWTFFKGRERDEPKKGEKSQQPSIGMNLESRALEEIASRRIGLLASPPTDGDYYVVLIKGIGETESDDAGALRRFLNNLDIKNPKYVRDLRVEYEKDRRNGGKQRSVSVMGYVTRHKPA